jgi:hypothetical protein
MIDAANPSHLRARALFAALPIPVILFLVLAILPIRFQVGPLQFTGLRLFVLVMFVPCLVKCVRNWSGRAALVDLLFALQAVWIFVSIHQVAPEAGIERAGSVCIDFLGGFAIARAYITDARKFRAMILWIATLCLLLLPMAVYEAFTTNAPLINTIGSIPAIRSVPLIDMPERLGLDRAQVAFAHPIHFGLFMSSAVALIYCGLAGFVAPFGRLLLCCFALAGVFFSLSSGAFMSGAIQIALIFWMILTAKIPHRWLLLCLVLAGTYLAIDLLSTRTPFRVFLSYATFSPHNAYWRAMILEWGIQNALAHPWFGVGNNGWDRPGFMNSGSMDNFWLYLAVKYGFPSLIFTAAGCLIALVVVGFSNVGKFAKLRHAWLVTMIALCVALTTVHIWTSIFSYVFFLFGAGLWMASPSKRAKPKPHSKRLPYARKQTSDPGLIPL